MFYFVFWLKLKFNLVLKRLTKKCTITKFKKKLYVFLSVFALHVLYSIYISQWFSFVGIVSLNLNVLRSPIIKNQSNWNLIGPAHFISFSFFVLFCFVFLLVCNDLVFSGFRFLCLGLSYSNNMLLCVVAYRNHCLCWIEEIWRSNHLVW